MKEQTFIEKLIKIKYAILLIFKDFKSLNSAALLTPTVRCIGLEGTHAVDLGPFLNLSLRVPLWCVCVCYSLQNTLEFELSCKCEEGSDFIAYM